MTEEEFDELALALTGAFGQACSKSGYNLSTSGSKMEQHEPL
jgi:hypothetical protein